MVEDIKEGKEGERKSEGGSEREGRRKEEERKK